MNQSKWLDGRMGRWTYTHTGIQTDTEMDKQRWTDRQIDGVTPNMKTDVNSHSLLLISFHISLMVVMGLWVNLFYSFICFTSEK